jgi:hypothetical protein
MNKTFINQTQQKQHSSLNWIQILKREKSPK